MSTLTLSLGSLGLILVLIAFRVPIGVAMGVLPFSWPLVPARLSTWP